MSTVLDGFGFKETLITCCLETDIITILKITFSKKIMIAYYDFGVEMQIEEDGMLNEANNGGGKGNNDYRIGQQKLEVGCTNPQQSSKIPFERCFIARIKHKNGIFQSG